MALTRLDSSADQDRDQPSSMHMFKSGCAIVARTEILSERFLSSTERLLKLGPIGIPC